MKPELEFRNTIVENAAKVFSQYGYRKTRMQDIANAVNKGKSSLYYYFKNKDEVFKAVIEYEASVLRREVIDSIAEVNEPMAKLKNYILTRMKVYKRVDNFYKIITNDSLMHLSFIEEIRRKYELDEINLLKNILTEGVANKHLKIKEPYITARTIVIALKGLETPLFNEPDQPLDERMNQLLEVLFYGIANTTQN